MSCQFDVHGLIGRIWDRREKTEHGNQARADHNEEREGQWYPQFSTHRTTAPAPQDLCFDHLSEVSRPDALRERHDFAERPGRTASKLSRRPILATINDQEAIDDDRHEDLQDRPGIDLSVA
jgi:hypothetical protein